MTATSPIFRGSNLKEILAEAHEYVLKNGMPRETSRGRTYSSGTITLSWEQPSNSESSHWSWPQQAADFYQDVFVEGKPGNAPEHLAAKGDLVFPYTYAARSRFWDGGWGYVLAVAQATRVLQESVSAFTKTEETFREYLEAAGELVHLQVLLSVWDWLGEKQLSVFVREPGAAQAFIERSRIDQLARIIREIEQNPGSRRAVTASFVYPEIDQRLEPVQGIPPYQFFQLLPGKADEPLNSFHVHRSLDAGHGVQLDFLHDYYWLSQASKTLGRSLGTISVVAGDFHVYLATEEAPPVSDITGWLLGVTDGYRTGQGNPAALLQKDFYRQNLQRVFRKLEQSRDSNQP